MDLFVLVVLLITGPVSLGCEIGFCNLNSWPETCRIPADTLCSPSTYCHSDGQCFKDQGSETVYCNCSDDRVGNTCQDVYTRDLTNCTSDTDCGGQGQCVLSETGAKTRCQCDPGFRGDRCELETRVYLAIGGLCRNEGVYYKQGTSDGCFCPCGYIGKYCEHISTEVVNDLACDQSFCNGHGKCAIDPVMSQFVCECYTLYSGLFCNQSRSTYTYTTLRGTVSTKAQNTNTKALLTTTSVTQNAVMNGCSDNHTYACNNGGSCLYNQTSQRYECYCTCDYYGPFCEYNRTSAQICDAYGFNCYNGGSCVVHYCSEIYCMCFNGYTGSHCEDRSPTSAQKNNPSTTSNSVDCSENKPCGNYGTCMNSTCSCKCGYFGPLCEYSTNPSSVFYRNWCVYMGTFCQNGGLCYYDSNSCGLKCLCPDSYVGRYCEVEYSTTMPLRNGSDCVKWIGCDGFSCEDNYRCQVNQCGTPYCEYDSSKLQKWAGGVTSVLICVLICILIPLISCIRSRRLRRMSSADPAAAAVTLPPPPGYQQSAADTSVHMYRGRQSDVISAPPQPEPLPDYLPHTDLPSYEEVYNQPPSYSDIMKQQTG